MPELFVQVLVVCGLGAAMHVLTRGYRASTVELCALIAHYRERGAGDGDAGD